MSVPVLLLDATWRIDRVIGVNHACSLLVSNEAVAASIGEELEFELRTLIPVAQLRNFVIRDELPAGMRCIAVPDPELRDDPRFESATHRIASLEKLPQLLSEFRFSEPA